MKGDGDRQSRLEQARELVSLLEAGDEQGADTVLQKLTDLHESALFQELGRLTRQLHEAINGFLLDERLQALAQHEMKDAAERLSYVIEMTEKSANTTLNAVEQSMPLVEGLTRQAQGLDQRWRQFRERELSVDDFRTLTAELSEFFPAIVQQGGELGGQLNAVLMAQDFQDLTGQIIRKVIGLVQDVEDKLVQIIRLSGARPGTKEARQLEAPTTGDESGHGPPVPGVDTGDLVQGQDDVDDLLSSLGF
jgi:chemotaxis protein CheZ